MMPLLPKNVALAATVLVMMNGVQAQYPVVVNNCNVTSSIASAPQRAVTLNQGTTEIMLGKSILCSIEFQLCLGCYPLNL